MIEKEDNILNSVEGIKKAVAPNFFYTKLIGKMQHIAEDKKVMPLIFRPALLAAVLTFILLLNVFSLTQLTNKPVDKLIQQQNSGIDAFKNAFSINNQEIY